MDVDDDGELADALGAMSVRKECQICFVECVRFLLYETWLSFFNPDTN